MRSLKKTSAWKWFSLYIKERDNWTCFTCGRKGQGREINAGHFIQAFGHQATFFDETNVHAQCVYCNLTLNGNLLEYRRRIIKKYGAGYDRVLEKRAQQVKKWSKEELKEIVKKYKEKYQYLLSKR